MFVPLKTVVRCCEDSCEKLCIHVRLVKILHFNTAAGGGSAVLMVRLHRTLREIGHDSQIRFRHGEQLNEVSASRLEYCNGPFDRLLERARYSFENRLLNEYPASYFSRLVLHRGTPIPVRDLDADIIHLHWVGRWLDLPSFIGSLPPQLPIVWTIHDMSPLAGGCFLDFGCGEFDSGCKRCPLLKSPFDRFLASDELARRRKALAGRRVAIVANSESTRRLAERSPLFSSMEKYTIYPGVDFSTLQPLETGEAKRALGIDPDCLLLGFGAASLTDRNKGVDRFFEVAAAVSRARSETEVLLFGDGEPFCPYPALKVHHQGKVSTPAHLSLVMSAMDAFIVTSQMETFGQVAVEAQACGTPVWSFAVGGLPETLDPGQSGGLELFGETGRMAADILACRNADKLSAMGAAGYTWVRSRFGTERSSSQYVDLYQYLLMPSE
jgi:glycosyltransferase involved in cell wall biosynthesis